MKKMNELVDLAIKATPGPWKAATDWERAAVYSTNKHAYPENKRVVCSGNQNNHKRFNNEPWSGSDWNDAAFIAAANPATILAIAEKFQSLERRVEAAEAEVQRLNATAQPVSDGCKVPEGWKIVPLEPTEEMREAYYRDSVAPVSKLSKSGYRAMLAAAPGGQDD